MTMSIVRENLMNIEHYTPYCGNDKCRNMPRTKFINGQFYCHACSWKSSYEKEFIEMYKMKWKK